MMDWRNRIIEFKRMKVNEITGHERNPKRHPKHQADAMRGMLDEVGMVDTLKAYYGEDGKLRLFDGHLRQSLDPDQEWPVIITDLTEAEARLMLVAFDPLAALAERDAELLAGLMHDVNVGDAALQQMLTDMAEDAGIVPKASPVATPPGIDRAEELQQKWGVESGDIWRIDEHLVICGDCRDSAIWQTLLSAAGVDKVNGVFTSPPYAEQRKEQYGGTPAAAYVDWWKEVQGNVRANLAGDGSFFVNIKAHCEDGQRVLYVMDLVTAMVRRWGWRYVDEFCWRRKGPPGSWPERLRNDWEPVHQFNLGGTLIRHDAISRYTSDAPVKSKKRVDHQGGYWNMPTETGEGIAHDGNVIEAFGIEPGLSHVAAFPVALPDFFIRAYSDLGDVWLDPFCGSGTTIVAAHQNQRRGIGIEYLPKYLAIILERLSTVTGKTPERVES